MARVANSSARAYVNEREPFRGNNTYGETLADGSYVVYSYGPHWPLYLWFAPVSRWFCNPAKYSRTTSRHANQLRPRDVSIRHIDKMHLLTLIRLCNDTCVSDALRIVGVELLEPVQLPAQLELPSARATDWQTLGPRRLMPLER